MHFYAAAGEVEDRVSARLVVERVVPARGHGAVEVLEVEDVWTSFVAYLCGGDDAFEQERVGNSYDEGTGRSAVDADAAEFGLHGHVGFDDSGIRDGADEVEEGGDGFAG